MPYAIYNTADIKRMKQLIRTGQPIRQIAKNLHKSFNATESGFLQKLYQVARHTTKIRKWEGPKRVRTSKTKNVPSDNLFEIDVAPKRVVVRKDHVRIYF